MLALARYRFHFTAITPVNLPEWPGSALRGAFGHALRRLACMTRQKDCAGCPLLATCPYPAIFAPPALGQSPQQQPPTPYIIEPAAWGRQHIEAGSGWYIDLVLMGRALTDLPLVILAWQKAAQKGIGPGDGQSSLSRIDHLSEESAPEMLWSEHEPHIKSHTPHRFDNAIDNTPSVQHITLTLDSPLRLQDNGHALPPNRLTPAHLLMAAVRRASHVSQHHGAGNPPWPYAALPKLAAAVDGEKALKWQDWGRYSSRQGQTMKLGGVIGHWTLNGELTPFMPALRIGQWLHIGKETVFGLGRYHIADTSSARPLGRERPSQSIEMKGENTTEQIQISPDF